MKLNFLISLFVVLIINIFGSEANIGQQGVEQAFRNTGNLKTIPCPKGCIRSYKRFNGFLKPVFCPLGCKPLQV
ncbi:unnamed protein product [Brachionus calyciflorus]|uniref:Uncharacterized protein n=1 Tax=Brachionus calyciflorus TaxID=104777 RepID=A0A814CPJ6_9BILA|nr:unnamed protein product [Brachionus calyciflorus]